MNTFLILAPMVGAGIGLAAAIGVANRERRIHFVKREQLNEELDDLDIDIGPAETCVECGDELEPEDVGAIVRVDGEYRVLCSKPSCLDTYDVE